MSVQAYNHRFDAYETINILSRAGEVIVDLLQIEQERESLSLSSDEMRAILIDLSQKFEQIRAQASRAQAENWLAQK